MLDDERLTIGITTRDLEAGATEHDAGTLTVPADDLVPLRLALGRTLRALAVATGAEEPFPDLEGAREDFPNAGAPWLPQHEHELRRRFDAGEPVDALAERFGRTVGAIRARLELLGRNPEQPGWRPPPESEEDPGEVPDRQVVWSRGTDPPPASAFGLNPPF